MIDESKRKYYTPQEVADICEVKVITVWDWIRSHKLKAFRFGGRYYKITQEHLDEFLARAEQ